MINGAGAAGPGQRVVCSVSSADQITEEGNGYEHSAHH